MSDAETMEERHSRMLARLAELSLGLAEAVQAEAVAAEEPEQQAKLAQAFARVSYAAHQCIALEARLVRDAERARDLSTDRAETRRAVAQTRRSAQLRLTLGRAASVHTHGFERDARLHEVDRLITEGLHFEGFSQAPIEDQIATLCDYLDLDPDEARDMSPFADELRSSPTGGGAGKADGVGSSLGGRGLHPPQSATLTAPPEGEHPQPAWRNTG